MYECFKRNSGTYIKLGQMVGTLEILLPDEYVETFEPMFQEAPTSSMEDVRAIIEADMKAPLEEVFEGTNRALYLNVFDQSSRWFQ